MRRYRIAPVSVIRPRADDDWEANEMARSITVYEAEEHWQPIPVLDPNTLRPVEVYVGPETIGFLTFEDEE